MRGPNENEARVLSSNQSSSDASNTIFLHKGETSSYIIPSYDSNSTEIVFNGFPLPLHLGYLQGRSYGFRTMRILLISMKVMLRANHAPTSLLIVFLEVVVS